MAATRRSHDGDGDRASVEEGYFARKSVLRRWSTRQGAKDRDSDNDSDSGGRPSRRKENRASDSDNHDQCLYYKATDGHWKRQCPVFKREDPKGFNKYNQKLERAKRKSLKKQQSGSLPA